MMASIALLRCGPVSSRACGARLARCASAAFALLLASACGGTSEDSRRVPGNADELEREELDLKDCDAISKDYEFLLLDGFDAGDITDGKNTAPALGWYISHDRSNGDDENPRADINFSPNKRTGLLPEEDGAPSLAQSNARALCDDSPSAMHLRSSNPGFTEWGYSLGANIKAEAGGIDYRNAADWDGLALWTKRKASSANPTLTAKVTDQYTEPSNHDYCLDGLFVPESCDAFSRGVGPDTEWRLVLIPFEDMVQQGFGRPSPQPQLEVDALVGVEFNLSGGTWDLWIDEVAWYRTRSK
jgi:hypothetical protein